MRIFKGLPANHYKLIHVDPPWNFKTHSQKGLEGRPQHYERMTLADIKAMPIYKLAAKDCHLFLWTTAPHLGNAFDVLRAWGFKYQSVGFTWAKLNKNADPKLMTQQDFHMGQGYTTRGNAEFCLLAKMGSPKRRSKSVRELIVGPRRSHSEKPEEVYTRCEEYAEGPYLDLFARKRRPGWDAWGNEVEKLK